MKIIEAPKYCCTRCRKKFDTAIEDYGDPEVTSESRNMGSETQFLWTYEFSCPNCSNDIEITIEGYEYPEGFFNYEQTTSRGSLILEKAKLETEHYTEE